jgi:XTP/dITP diphosphohydrolase
MPENRRIVLASNNPGKIQEINSLLQAMDIEAVPQKEFTAEEAVEDGLSFVENALLKARFAAKASGLPAIADDSGIEVDALDGAPGIYSARYAGDNASDLDNLQKLLKELKAVPEEKRSARFQCLMVYVRHANDPVPLRILTAPQGENGFGYDPVFLVPEENCSAAELSAERKNQLSHRGKALKQLVEKLTEQG